MKSFAKVVFVILFGLTFWKLPASAQGFSGDAEIGIDGSGNYIAIWRKLDIATGNYEMRGANGNPFSIVTLTDPTKVSIIEEPPGLAVIGGTSGTTRAIAVWNANDLITTNNIIQVAILTKKKSSFKWSTTPITLSSNDGSENPQNDFKVAITPDGQNIIVTWTAFVVAENGYRVRSAMSADGGNTWGLGTSQ